MLFTNLFTKTSKDIPADEVSKNAKLLIQAGFIYKVMAGVYAYLPLGIKVLEKIKQITREEMNKIGGQELIMTSLQKKETWEVTDRWSDEKVDVWFKSKLKNNTEVGFGWSHEEAIIEMMKGFVASYKDLPANVYQFQTKMRNELRNKSGIMRGREFVMKDMYSCSIDAEQHEKFYQETIKAYLRVFDRVGLRDNTYVTFASGGAFTDFSHEFQTICDAGEDCILLIPGTDFVYNQEVAPAKVSPNKYEEPKIKEDVLAENITGVKALLDFLKIDITKSTKTLFFEVEDNKMIAACLRSDCDLNEEKLMKVGGFKKLQKASEDLIEAKTGAKIGYAGIINLPKDIQVFVDDSLENLCNFETGTNKTGYHSINVNFGRDVELPEKFVDIKLAKEGYTHPETGKVYETRKSVETGNIFNFGTVKSEQTNFKFTNKEGKEQFVHLGSYGIGITRLMGVIAENYADENGLVWPKSVAPFQIHLITNFSKKDEETNQKILDIANKIYNQELKIVLNQETKKYEILDVNNLTDITNFAISDLETSDEDEVLWDNRDKISIGQKLKDADLIGCPVQVVVSERSLQNGGVEIKDRQSGEGVICKIVSF